MPGGGACVAGSRIQPASASSCACRLSTGASGDIARSAACDCTVPAHGDAFLGKLRERREALVPFPPPRPPPAPAGVPGSPTPARLRHRRPIGGPTPLWALLAGHHPV